MIFIVPAPDRSRIIIAIDSSALNFGNGMNYSNRNDIVRLEESPQMWRNWSNENKSWFQVQVNGSSDGNDPPFFIRRSQRSDVVDQKVKREAKVRGVY